MCTCVIINNLTFRRYGGHTDLFIYGRTTDTLDIFTKRKTFLTREIRLFPAISNSFEDTAAAFVTVSALTNA